MEIGTSVNKTNYFEPSYSWVYNYLDNNSAYHLRNMNKIHYAVKIINHKLKQKYGPKVHITLNPEYQIWLGEHTITMGNRIPHHFDDLKLLKFTVQLNFVSIESYFYEYEKVILKYVHDLFKWLGVETDVDNPPGTMSTGGFAFPPNLNHSALPYRSHTHFVDSINICGQDMYSVTTTTSICFESKIERFSKPKNDYVFDYDWQRPEEKNESLMDKIKEYFRWS